MQCGLNGEWPSGISWPTCNVEYCVAASQSEPVISGFNKDIGQPTSVAVGDKLVYHCQTGGDVLDAAAGGNAKGKLEVKCR